MATITIEVTDQELATLTTAARLREAVKDGSPDWAAFYLPWHRDAYNQVQRAAASMVADNPEQTAQVLAQLNEQLDAQAAAAAPIEEIPTESTAPETTDTETTTA